MAKMLPWIWLPLTTSLAPHYSCTSPMDCISHHSLHSHIPIHHYTNHTAVTNHSLTLIVSPHLHLIHTHTHISSTLPCKHCEVLFLPRLTLLSVIQPAICYLCVWHRTARPWNSEPVLVTSTPAWYCLRLCPASDIPVFARWPLPVWFCPLNILLHMDPHAFDQSLQMPNRKWGCILTMPEHIKMKCMILETLGRYRHTSSSRQFHDIFVDWKFLIIALMVEMGIFTALALFLKPLH